MKSVFIDLEFCEVDRQNVEARKTSSFEVIEVGAVKLDEKNQIIGRFDSLVKPEYGVISDFIAELTHITNEMVSEAETFTKVMDSFLSWVGKEPVTIYSWSNSDGRQLKNECALKEYNVPEMERLYENWIDYQKMFCNLLEIPQAVSLEKALLAADVEFSGQKHSALADAENTAILFTLTKDEKQFKKKAARIISWLMPTPKIGVSLGSLIPENILEEHFK